MKFLKTTLLFALLLGVQTSFAVTSASKATVCKEYYLTFHGQAWRAKLAAKSEAKTKAKAILLETCDRAGMGLGIEEVVQYEVTCTDPVAIRNFGRLGEGVCVTCDAVAVGNCFAK
jgi:hypothetical protein